MQQRDASRVPQVLPFRPPDNSPFKRHLTHKALLCFFYTITYFSLHCQNAKRIAKWNKLKILGNNASGYG